MRKGRSSRERGVREGPYRKEPRRLCSAVQTPPDFASSEPRRLPLGSRDIRLGPSGVRAAFLRVHCVLRRLADGHPPHVRKQTTPAVALPSAARRR